jgi:hypothetical protein
MIPPAYVKSFVKRQKYDMTPGPKSLQCPGHFTAWRPVLVSRLRIAIVVMDVQINAMKNGIGGAGVGFAASPLMRTAGS